MVSDVDPHDATFERNDDGTTRIDCPCGWTKTLGHVNDLAVVVALLEQHEREASA